MDKLIEKMLTGNIVAAARLITLIENDRSKAKQIIKTIFPHTGNAYIIGVTGSPGAGKSTLISELIRVLSKTRRSVGVLAIDASSPFTGGAVLGDRIRMQKNEGENIFVRSMATRGNLGGISKATRDASYVMDAMGLDIIIIETVGVGQVELEISRLAYSTVVVLAPGMGDSIQAMKAGIMEIGDIFVVNKADRKGATETYNDINGILSYKSFADTWRPKIYKTTAIKSEGIDELVDGLQEHENYLKEKSLLSNKYYDKEQLLSLIKERVENRIINNDKGEEYFDDYVKDIIAKKIDPYSASEIILKEVNF
ncbi:MAG: methylmalonyl Co-A mutase-associated GTPase MeaB [Desulfosarcina sp.]|nr:methylmalonyl Co-A mutase-associated GTPase MeaB [Desulfobacterales bacterium]